MSTQTVGLFEAKTHFSAVDYDKRRQALSAIAALREELQQQGACVSSSEVVKVLRDMRDEQTDRKGRA